MTDLKRGMVVRSEETEPSYIVEVEACTATIIGCDEAQGRFRIIVLRWHQSSWVCSKLG